MIIDTHCHYNLEPLYSDNPEQSDTWQRHWQQAQAHGVAGSIVVGTNHDTNRLATHTIAPSDPNLWCSVGIHPNEWSEDTVPQWIANGSKSLEKIVSEHLRELRDFLPNEKVVAIGETGLDYFHFPADLDTEIRELIQRVQQDAFRQQLQLANEHDLPLIVHVRDRAIPETPTTGNAYWDVLSILQEERPTQPFILHCISGPLSYVKAAVEMGAYIGIAGNVTYKNADHIRSLVKTAPRDRLLLETDAPYLPPVPHRGQSCEPWMISETAAYLRDELGLELDQLLSNTCRLFPVFRNLVP